MAMRDSTPPEISLSTEQVCFLIVKAREFDVKDVVTEPDPASNPSDDHMVAVLENHGDDPSRAEFTAFVNAMSVDEQIDLVALARLGRGDGGIEDWAELRGEAARQHNRRTAQYLLGMPLLADHLEEGLSAFGRSCEDEDMERL